MGKCAHTLDAVLRWEQGKVDGRFAHVTVVLKSSRMFDLLNKRLYTFMILSPQQKLGYQNKKLIMHWRC